MNKIIVITHEGKKYDGQNMTVFPEPNNRILVISGELDYADAVINFPKIDGETVLFVHRLRVNCADDVNAYVDELWNWIKAYARHCGFHNIYAYRSKVSKTFVKKHDFQEVSNELLKLTLDNE